MRYLVLCVCYKVLYAEFVFVASCVGYYLLCLGPSLVLCVGCLTISLSEIFLCRGPFWVYVLVILCLRVYYVVFHAGDIFVDWTILFYECDTRYAVRELSLGSWRKFATLELGGVDGFSC